MTNQERLFKLVQSAPLRQDCSGEHCALRGTCDRNQLAQAGRYFGDDGAPQLRAEGRCPSIPAVGSSLLAA